MLIIGLDQVLEHFAGGRARRVSVIAGALFSYGVAKTMPGRGPKTSLCCHRRSLALTFRTGGMPLFIHWRLPRAATTGHRSLSTATRWRRQFLFRRMAGSGRRWRWCGRRRRAPRATGSGCATPRSRRHPREGSPPLSRSDISGWRDAALYPLAVRRRAPRRHAHGRSAERPAGAAAGRRRRRRRAQHPDRDRT